MAGDEESCDAVVVPDTEIVGHAADDNTVAAAGLELSVVVVACSLGAVFPSVVIYLILLAQGVL